MVTCPRLSRTTCHLHSEKTLTSECGLTATTQHAGEKQTRRSRTGFFIYINMACIDWVSKRQSKIETLVFGAEFVAMKHGVEKLRGLRYKLRMMGMPLALATSMATTSPLLRILLCWNQY